MSRNKDGSSHGEKRGRCQKSLFPGAGFLVMTLKQAQVQG